MLRAPANRTAKAGGHAAPRLPRTAEEQRECAEGAACAVRHALPALFFLRRRVPRSFARTASAFPVRRFSLPVSPRTPLPPSCPALTPALIAPHAFPLPLPALSPHGAFFSPAAQTNACLVRENGVETPGYTQCTHRQRPGFPRGEVAPRVKGQGRCGRQTLFFQGELPWLTSA